jgi:tetratricopeptide (TPR) repeat protein
MKMKFWAIICVITILLASCATTGSGRTAFVDDAVFEGDGVSLTEAIEQSAEKIAVDLPAGSRVAIVAWVSPSAGLSDYVMEELTGALVDRDMGVADRQNLEYVYRELGFQMSGDVSEESARAIGKFLGADIVIIGQLTELGGPYRYRTSAINVESATRDSVMRLDVRGDAALRRIVTALANQKTAVKTASYGEGGKAAPKTAGAFLDRGITLASQGEFESAIADFTEAITLNSALSAAYLLRGRALFASVSVVTKVDENFSRITVLSTGGNVSADKRAVIDRAIADYTQAIRLDPNNAVAHRERGVAYFDEGDQDRAKADYTQAIRLDPNDANVYFSRGREYLLKGDYDRAIADQSQAIRLNPNLVEPYSNRGNVYYRKGDYARAIADHTQAIKVDPNYANAYSNRGVVYYAKGDYDRAIADFEAALRINPNHTNAKTNLENARRALRQ